MKTRTVDILTPCHESRNKMSTKDMADIALRVIK
jgi:hypothetical protein